VSECTELRYDVSEVPYMYIQCGIVIHCSVDGDLDCLDLEISQIGAGRGYPTSSMGDASHPARAFLAFAAAPRD
jgi:hypothetical protein